MLHSHAETSSRRVHRIRRLGRGLGLDPPFGIVMALSLRRSGLNTDFFDLTGLYFTPSKKYIAFLPISHTFERECIIVHMLFYYRCNNAILQRNLIYFVIASYIVSLRNNISVSLKYPCLYIVSKEMKRMRNARKERNREKEGLGQRPLCAMRAGDRRRHV